MSMSMSMALREIIVKCPCLRGTRLVWHHAWLFLAWLYHAWVFHAYPFLYVSRNDNQFCNEWLLAMRI